MKIEMLLLDRYLVYATLVSSAFKWSVEELIHDFAGHVMVDETAWHD